MPDFAKVFISLTTISTRLHTLDRIIAGLINQTRKADRIILNISLDPYLLDQGIRFEQLPEQTRSWAISGEVELYFCRNTGPYRKIIPVLDRFGYGDYYIATADDDILYPPEWLEVLHATAVAHGCIAAYRCRQMLISGDGFAPYRDWPLLTADGSAPALDRLPTGRDGVIYHASYFKDQEILRPLMLLAPQQDDIALRFATLAAEIPVAIAPRQNTSSPNGVEFPESRQTDRGLWVGNYDGKNDKALAACATWVREHPPVKAEPETLQAPATPTYKYKYSVAANGRWEHEDILEWVSYYKSIGFDHIYFFSNDDDPMPTFKVLTPFLFGEDPFVTFKHFPKPDPNVTQHPYIFHYFMKNYLHETEWFAIFDIDEYLVLKDIDNIHVFMREFEHDVDCVYFNWLVYGHSGKAERDNESLLLSHTQRERSADVHTKWITRSSKIDADAIFAEFRRGGRAIWWHFWSQYNTPGLRQVNVLWDAMDEYGIEFPTRAISYFKQPGKRAAIIEKAYVAHYQFRSISDLRRRIARGGTTVNKIWEKNLAEGTHLRRFEGRNDVWDVYLANYWLRHVGNAYDISLKTKAAAGRLNLALRKPAIQSSWHEPTPEDPKGSFPQGHANNGIRTGNYGFRTMFEERPWWMVDLLDILAIEDVVIYNDVSSESASRCAAHLMIEISLDQLNWNKVYQMRQDAFESWLKHAPLVVSLKPDTKARYIRVSSEQPTELRLDEVEVYGPREHAP